MLDPMATNDHNPAMSRLMTGKRRGVLALLMVAGLWLLCAGLSAQAADRRPYIPFPKERYRIFVFGDKMATGLLAGLWRVLKNNPKFIARGRFRAGTGLVRLSYYDWQRAIARVVNSRQVDIAIVMLGINDMHDIFLGGRRIPFGSDEWKRIYASRVDAIIDTAKNAGVALYWVGLPPVRDPALDVAVGLINTIIRERTRAAGVRFIDIRRHFLGPNGSYTDTGRGVNGQLTRLRARDGIHFIRPGNTKLAKIVMDIILKDVKEAERSDAAPALSGVEETDKPYVGRAAPDGTPIYTSPAELPSANEVYLARHAPAASVGAAGVLAALRKAAPPDSETAKLFIEGRWPETSPKQLGNFALPSSTGKSATRKVDGKMSAAPAP